MVKLYDIMLIVEVILLIAMIFGSYYGRKLNMNLHHKLIYGTVGIQLLIFMFYMAPAAAYWRDSTGIGVILGLHMVMGVLTLISSLIICIIFLLRKNQFDLPLLRWTKPFMVFTFILWVITFSLGFTFYLTQYIFN